MQAARALIGGRMPKNAGVTMALDGLAQLNTTLAIAQPPLTRIDQNIVC